MIVLVYLVLCVLVGVAANAHGRSGVGFFFLSLFLSPLIGLICVVIFAAAPKPAAPERPKINYMAVMTRKAPPLLPTDEERAAAAAAAAAKVAAVRTTDRLAWIVLSLIAGLLIWGAIEWSRPTVGWNRLSSEPPSSSERTDTAAPAAASLTWSYVWTYRSGRVYVNTPEPAIQDALADLKLTLVPLSR
jgi:hypothetical protein